MVLPIRMLRSPWSMSVSAHKKMSIADGHLFMRLFLHADFFEGNDTSQPMRYKYP